VERESETGIDTSTLTREARKPKLSSEKARKLLGELEEEPEELEELREELPDKDGESRELVTHKLGGVTDSESTDGDSAGECQDLKVTGILEDTLILERSLVQETGELLKSTGENLVLKKEEISLLIETSMKGNLKSTLKDSQMSSGLLKLR